MRKKFVQFFYFLSRIVVRYFAFVILYQWHEKKFNISQKLDFDELNEFLNKLKPKRLTYGLRRFGTDGDGGYLLPLEIDSFDACFSPGVDKNSEFELEIANTFGCPVFMVDGSVESTVQAHDLFSFQKLWLAVSDSFDSISLSNWVDISGFKDSTNLLLQMDIEGCEYQILKECEDNFLEKFKIIVIEFHSFENILAKRGSSYRSIILDLLETHEVVHIHPNNVRRPYSVYGKTIPTDLEVTFVRKNLLSFEDEYAVLPNNEDFDNVNRKTICINW